MRGNSSLASLTLTVCLAAGLAAVAHAQNPPPWTPSVPKGDVDVNLVPVVTMGALSAPVFATHAGDGSGRLFIVDQPGRIRILTGGGTLLDVPFLDLVASGDVVDVNPNFDERGLLGLAFHPDYKKNGRFFVRYSKARAGAAGEPCFGTSRGCHEEVLAEFRVSANDPNRADPASQRIVFRVDEPEFNHDGGHVAFGPAGERRGAGDDDDDDDDALLYFGLGDGGGANDGLSSPSRPHGPNGNGLNNRTHLGSLLRIDVDGALPYAIPGDNPFAGGGCDDGCDEIYAYGLRNPYRFAFDPKDGRLFLGDVGQGFYEEVNIIKKGGNYGWVRAEGFHCFDPVTGAPPSTCSPVGLFGEPLLNPIAEYSHEDGIAVVGGMVYRGRQEALRGKYIFGDFSRGFVPGNGRLFWLDADGATTDIFEFGLLSPSDPLMRYVLGFGQDESGEIYVLTSQSLGPNPDSSTGEVFHIVAGGGANSLHHESLDDSTVDEPLLGRRSHMELTRPR